ncbi:uncharacterized protein LOC124202557 [Daphnia pulex]|uniref:uncharacterized protein LOC124202557 n=1 Tax=Daphnia pulex TaxID=6669 RepID=UPI001EDF6A47|nr:uncharacterized protein LOC124202557 [Daphnia pulex]
MRTNFLFLLFVIASIIESSAARKGGGRTKFPPIFRTTTVRSTGSRKTIPVLKCYSCDDAHLCAINPVVYARQIICPKGELCSVQRKELPATTDFNESGGVKSSNTKTTEFISAPNNMSLARVSIWRGCKSPVSVNHTSSYLTTHFCATDLCNQGDGRLKCYKCNGTGIHDKCMVNPLAVAKQVICQPNEACYVKRFTMADNSTSRELENQWVSRGCIQSDVVNVKKYRSNHSITAICRIGDFCNWMNALTVDSTSELRVSLTIVGLAFLFTLIF